MSKSKNLLLFAVLLLIPAVALAQASPAPLNPLGGPISDIDRMMREKDTNERFHNQALLTLNLSYNSAGDLRSTLTKSGLHSVFMTLEVDETLIKKIAKSKKPKVQEAVKPGQINVKGRWARPGTQLKTKCIGELTVGFHQVVFLPYGGEGFTCVVEPRNLPKEVWTEWQAGFTDAQKGSYNQCVSKNPNGGGGFWTCIEGAGIALPVA